MRKLLFTVTKDSEVGKKLIELQKQYANDEYALADALQLLRGKIESTACDLEKQTSIPAEEFISAIYRATWEAFDTAKEKEGGNCFTTYLTEIVNKRLIDAMRWSHGTYAEKIVLASDATYYEDSEYESNTILDYLDGVVSSPESLTYITEGDFDMIRARELVENEVIDRLMRVEQRNLLDYLYDHVPENVRAYANELIVYDGASLTQVAKNFGVHHSKVTRSIRRISNLYDPKKFGDQNDYLLRAREQFPRY